MSGDQVVLLDADTDLPIGVADKALAHAHGYYHAAISVILIDSAGRQLIQRRALNKYHCGGLWSNACCTHPRLGEHPRDAALRRLGEELGVTTRLVSLGVVRYWAKVSAEIGAARAGGSIMEHERVDIFGGFYDGTFRANAEEVADTRWMSMSELMTDTDLPLTPWFRLYLNLLGAEPKDLLLAMMAAKLAPFDFGYRRLNS